MAAGCALCGVFVIFLVFGSQTGPTRAASAAGVTICSCDLSPGNCDLNCCCDPDCTPTPIFSSCLPGSTRAERWACLYSWLMFRNNAPYLTALVGSPPARLFCVLSADASVGEPVAPQKVSSLGELHAAPSFSRASQGAPGFSGFYRAGDPVLTLSTSNAVGVLRQPGPAGPHHLCADNNPAKFLQGGSTSCLRLFSNLSASCETEPVLRAAHYSQGVAVLRVPSDVSSQAANPVLVSGSVTSRPVLQGEWCHDVVSQVTYTVWYNGSQGIVNVSAAFVLGSVSGARLQQTFTVTYKAVDAAAGSAVQTRSGNPGYLVGYPVRSDIGTLYLLRSLGGESCGRAPLQFGINMLSGCSLRGTARDSCSDFQAQAYHVLQAGDAAHSLAVFGNSSGDWTPIIYRNCSGQGDCSSGCPTPVFLDMQIMWANVGLLSNPQAQLLGARFTYTCRQVKCQDVTLLQAQVSFTDLSRRGPAPRSSPGVTGRDPTDFFFPFRTSAALTSSGNPLLTLLLAAVGLSWTGPLS